MDITIVGSMGLLFLGVTGLGLILVGAFLMVGYILWRMMRNDGWDDSNVTNALRLLSHVTMHSEDFGKMYYVSDYQRSILGTNENPAVQELKQPFWYVSEDEFKGVVKTRPG